MIGVTEWNMAGRIVEANGKFLDMLGYTRADLKAGGIEWGPLTPPEYRYLDELAMAELKATGINRTPREKEYVRKDGTRIPVLVGGAMFDEDRFRGIAFVVDLTDRKRAEKALRDSEERLRMMIDSVKDYAIIMLDVGGRVASWNSGAERIKGYRAEEIVGQHFARFYPKEDIDSGRPERELAIAAAEGRVENEGWRVRKDGSLFWANAIITALRDDSGRLRGYAKLTRDITERRQAEEELRRRREHLEALVAERTAELAERNAALRESEARARDAEEAALTANKAKGEFLASMSHEMRTPLHEILGFANILAEGRAGEPNDQQRQYLRNIALNGEHLLQLIDDLLE